MLLYKGIYLYMKWDIWWENYYLYKIIDNIFFMVTKIIYFVKEDNENDKILT